MSSREYSSECSLTCFGIAAVVGLVSMVMLAFMAGFTPLQAIFTGGVIGTALAVVLVFAVCGGQTASADLASANKPAARYNAQAQGASAGTTSVVADAAAPAVVAAPAAAPAPAAVEAAVAAPALAKPKPAVAKTAEADAKPAIMLAAARPEGADDLKLIGGVGPKLEQTLNDLGIYHFDQVAKLKKKDIAWVDERLRFKGRIERDDWMAQAKILATGGETEFSKGKKKI